MMLFWAAVLLIILLLFYRWNYWANVTPKYTVYIEEIEGEFHAYVSDETGTIVGKTNGYVDGQQHEARTAIYAIIQKDLAQRSLNPVKIGEQKIRVLK